MSRRIAYVLLLCSAAAQADDAAPAAPPPIAKIKECIQEIDVGRRWHFEWKTIEIGKPRHPQNNTEALAFSGGAGRRADYGYPVHAVYALSGLADIDAIYWLIRDDKGRWRIPALC